MTRKRKAKKAARFGKKSREWRKKGNSGSNYLNALPEGFEFFKPKGGKKYKFDILPYIVKDAKIHPASDAINDDGLFWCLPYSLHKNVGPNDLLVICPKSVGRACCICEERISVYNDPDRDDDDAKPLFASPRVLYIVRFTSGPDKGEIKILDISDFCFGKLLNEELDDLPEEYEDFACLEDGYTIEVRFKEESFGKIKFAKASKINFLEREDYDESILDEVPCLDDLITWPSSEKIEKLFFGSESEETQEEQEEPDTANDLSWDDLKEMELDELFDVIEIEDLDIDEDEAEEASEAELRDFIAEELGIKKPVKTKAKKTRKTSTKSTKNTKRAKSTKSKSTKKALKCPYAYQFGTDFEEHEECDEDECKMYDKCLDAFENEE